MQFMYQAPIGLVRAAMDGEITMINPMAAQLLMPLAAGAGLDNLFDVLQGAAPQLRAEAAAARPGAAVCDGLRLPAGASRGPEAEPVLLSLCLRRLDAESLMCSVTDITSATVLERQRLAAGVRDARRIDSLTAMPTRAVVLERIELALQRARADAAYRFAVLFINGDRFNRVNVTLGPAAGDELLRGMAQRVNGAVRQRDAVALGSEGPRSAARLDVDEFVVLLEAVHSEGAATAVAQRLVDALGKPYVIGGASVHSTASIGVALGDGATADAESLLQDASLAMREAKVGGGARACVFAPEMKSRAQRRASLEGELRQALQEGQLFVVYQPITHLDDGRVAGVEALVRWQHPRRGVVPPVEFIEIAEESGLIGPLGAFVLEAACRQFMRWRQQLGTGAPPLLSVNLSRAQLNEPTLVDEVRRILQDSGMPAGGLQLEITESLAAENALIQSRLHELKALGVMLALDDFGTGYSSLSSLHLWPVDVIKIDRSFVSQVACSTHHRVLVEATVRVARSLGMGTVAEGVETTEQAEVLKALQCDKGQGYLYARPLPAADATRWLASREAAPAPAPPCVHPRERARA
jgi:diguanylate cyclase (GGDEF)-like protein